MSYCEHSVQGFVVTVGAAAGGKEAHETPGVERVTRAAVAARRSFDVKLACYGCHWTIASVFFAERIRSSGWATRAWPTLVWFIMENAPGEFLVSFFFTSFF